MKTEIYGTVSSFIIYISEIPKKKIIYLMPYNALIKAILFMCHNSYFENMLF